MYITAKNMLSVFSWMTEDLHFIALNFGVVVGKNGYVFNITSTPCLTLRGKKLCQQQRTS